MDRRSVVRRGLPYRRSNGTVEGGCLKRGVAEKIQRQELYLVKVKFL